MSSRRPQPRHKHRAIVEQYRPIRVGDIMTRERARLPCMCAIYVGRDAGMQAQTRSQACRADHALVIERADALMREAAEAPTSGRPMVDVARICLSKAARELI